MRLDVIVPTYNRAALLSRALDALAVADIPAGLDVDITVVDNGSTDCTRAVVEARRARGCDRLHYRRQERRGKSHALNAGIAATTGDLVGMLDDDEEVDPRWFAECEATFAAGDVDFAGGPCRPRWGAPPPPWLPPNYRGVIGWVDAGDRVRSYGADDGPVLMGGNAVVRRARLREVGPYSTALGPDAARPVLSGEDHDMYRRLLAAGARGQYRPGLAIDHWIPPERLTRRYFRRWCFWHGVALATMEAVSPSPGPRVAGLPRYYFGDAARALARRATRLSADPARRFEDELRLWELAGALYGRAGRRAPARPHEPHGARAAA